MKYCISWHFIRVFTIIICPSTNLAVTSIPKSLFESKQVYSEIAGTDSKTSDVLHQVTEDGDKVTSLLSWKSLGFSPLSLSYRPSDRLLVVGGECDRVKTFKLIPKDLKRKGWTMKSEDLINP